MNDIRGSSPAFGGRTDASHAREASIPDEAASVRLDHLTKRFGDVIAVDDLSLAFRPGEFVSLLGPSGCGKTTTLRMIGGFEEPTAGRVFLGDRDVTDLPPYKRDVNTVFQSYALFPHLNVFDNLAFGLRRRQIPAAEVRRRVGEMLDLVELPGYERRRPRQLSGGQQQRVALARALVNKPQVLLLDEPLGALDLKLRKQMQLELKRIQSGVGITFVYVTHDQDEAMTMSDRIAVMRDGRVDQEGPPEELYEHPRTSFVAGFLGVSNLLSGRVTAVRYGSAELALPSGAMVRAPAGGGKPGAQVRIGVRPEKLRLADGDADGRGGDNVIAGIVEDASYVGVSTQYTVRTADGLITAYAQNADTRGLGEAVRTGSHVQLQWDPRHTFIVDDADADPSEDANA